MKSSKLLSSTCMFPDLSTTNTIAYDTETSGLDPHEDYVVGHVITWGFRPEESVYLPIRHDGGGNLEEGPVTDYIRKTMLRTDLRVVMHNAAFDLWMTGKDGIVINGPIEDTGLNDPLIDENMGSKDGLRAAGYYGNEFLTGYSLESCCSRARVQAKKGQRMYEYLAEQFGGTANKEQMANYWRLAGDDPMAVEYAEGDGTSTLQLWAWQQARLDEQNLRKVWKVECDLIPVLHRARARGVPVDENELGKVREQVKKMRADAVDKVGGINVRAPSEILPYLESLATEGASDLLPPVSKDYTKARRATDVEEKWDTKIVPYPPMTKPSKRFPNGQPSYSTAYLKSFDGGADIIRVRKLAHLEDFSLTPLVEKHLYKGKVYPNFWQLASDDYGTVTGRLSSSGPNLQQVTKRNKELGRIYRRVFVAPEDRVLWEQDYSQCEYRLFAHFSNSRQLINEINKPGSDVHKVVADILGIERDHGKEMNFSLVYGQGLESTAAKLGISLSEAKMLRNQYFQKFPESKILMDSAKQRAMMRGYSLTVLGRRRRFTDPRAQAYKALNAVCQGGNADIIKMKMVEVDDYLRSSGRGEFAFSVHDALVSYLDPANDKETAEEIRSICKDFRKNVHGFQLRVGMELDAGHGTNWSIASYGEAA